MPLLPSPGSALHQHAPNNAPTSGTYYNPLTPPSVRYTCLLMPQIPKSRCSNTFPPDLIPVRGICGGDRPGAMEAVAMDIRERTRSSG